MADLPPQSRISCRIDGQVLSITLPRSSARVGCMGGNWAAAAVFAFLAVSCTAQGILGGNLLWTAAGFFFFLIAGWQLLALRGGIFHAPESTKLEIGPDSLVKIGGPTDAPQRVQWPRSAITDIRVEPRSSSGSACLNLHLNDAPQVVCLLSSSDADEMHWIAEQIRRKWKMVGGEDGG
jgi:hypothetical protein